MAISVWLGLAVGGLPLLLWWWNELWYAVPLKTKCSGSGTKLPSGHMGFPFIGEMLSFLFYFKFLRRPDDFINAKRRKYGDGVGVFRTHLFGSPAIITCAPLVNKFVLQSEESFPQDWPRVDLLGSTNLAAVHGKSHARLRNYVTSAINRPDALRRIALLVQPRMVAALQSWAQKGRIKVTFENIGALFLSLEPGPVLHSMDTLYRGLIGGFRAFPLKFPGSAYHHAVQCRKELDAIFCMELEKRKIKGEVQKADIMDRLIQMKDNEGNKLSDKEVVDNMVGLVVGAYETTALVSMWAVYYLAKFPNVLGKLREENMGFRKSKTGDFITSEDVSKLVYTNKVVEEAIRMANIAALGFRKAIKEIDYKGYKIPKGWKVIVMFRYLHTNPENFEDPMCFNPERWNEPAKPGTYQVFGGGSRICAGNMLARLQLAIFLHHLSIGYKWELINPDADVICLPHPAPVDGVEVTFSKV